MAKILIVGCGAIGLDLGNYLIAKGHTIIGLKRNPPISNVIKFNFFAADIASARDLQYLDTDFEQVFFIVSADDRSEQNYRNLYEIGLNNLLNKFERNNKPPTWLFVSSTSVYGQSQGEWVDENSLAQPDNACSQLIRRAELRLMNLKLENTIVRFSGIYGPGRESLIRMAKHSPAIQQSPPYYTNRIHHQDCVRVLAYLLEQRLAGITLESCYLASDDNPAPMWEVMSWLARQMHCKAPVTKKVSNENSMNKRCTNRRLKDLGFQFQYPSYKEGYQELIE